MTWMSMSHVLRLSADTRVMPGASCPWTLRSSFVCVRQDYRPGVSRRDTFWSLLLLIILLMMFDKMIGG